MNDSPLGSLPDDLENSETEPETLLDVVEEVFRAAQSNLDSYDQRSVNRYERGSLVIDTCRIFGSKQPFETAIRHPEFSVNWIIVEAYDTVEEAQSGHERWVDVMTRKHLPEELRDCCNSKISDLCVESGNRLVFARKVGKNS